jgi:acetyl-CoA C-acetyltransferase
MSLTNRSEFASFECSVLAAKQAYKMAKVTARQIDVAEVHDSFTSAEIMNYEDLGFCKRGEGGKFIEEGQSYIGGKMPVNVDGGLLQRGTCGCYRSRSHNFHHKAAPQRSRRQPGTRR